MTYPFIKAYRRSSRITQRILADLLGIHRARLNELERGKRRADLETALQLELVFGIPAAQLFPDTFNTIEEQVMARAKLIHEQLAGKTDELSIATIRLIEDLPRRRLGAASVDPA